MSKGALKYRLQSYNEAANDFDDSYYSRERKNRRYQQLDRYNTGDRSHAIVINPSNIILNLKIAPNDSWIQDSNITSRDVCFYIDRRQAMKVVYKSQLMSYDWGVLSKINIKLEPFLEISYIVLYFISLTCFIVSACKHWDGLEDILWITIGALLAPIAIIANILLPLCLVLLLLYALPPFTYNIIVHFRYYWRVHKFDSDVKMKTCREYIEGKAQASINKVLERDYKYEF